MKKSLELTLVVVLALLALVVGGTSGYAADSEAERENAAEKAKAPEKGAKPSANKQELTGEQLVLQKFMDDLFTESKKVNETGAPGKQAREKIEQSVAWDEVAKTCLGGPSAWAKYPKDRGEFASLLHDIIALTAYSRMDSFWKGTTYTINKIDVKGKSATVSAKFTADEEDYVLEYFLTKGAKGWQLFDLSFDDIKYSENIREQVQAFLKDQSFATLLAKLRKRKSELQTDKGATAKKASFE